MTKLVLAPALLVLALAGFSTGARASAVSVVITGTYSSDAATSAFSAPSTSFSVSFSLPLNIGSSLTVAGVPLTINFNGTMTTVPDVVTFFPSGRGGGFNIDIPTVNGISYEWQFLGTQFYDSSFNLVTGAFPILSTSPAQLLVTTIVNGLTITTFAPISSGTVALSASVSATPEPASLFLMGTGLLGLGFAIRRRHVRT